MSKRRTPAPILSPTFIWHPASSHSDIAAFAARQRDRVRRMQHKPDATVAQLKTRKA